MTPQCQPCREPLRTTILRNGLIAIVIGTVIALSRGRLARWWIDSLLAFWPSFGGHWIEVWFLNWLRPRLPVARGIQVSARLAVWFVGGTLLAAGMALTAMELGGLHRWPRYPWWLGGVAFIGIELLVHLLLQLFRRPSFYNGRG